jgi:hypothetical protein
VVLLGVHAWVQQSLRVSFVFKGSAVWPATGHVHWLLTLNSIAAMPAVEAAELAPAPPAFVALRCWTLLHVPIHCTSFGGYLLLS